MAIVGGLRARLIRDSLFHMVYDALDDLGWFDVGRKHKTLSFPSVPVDPIVEVMFNTVAIGDLGTLAEDWELGSNMSEFRWTIFVDVFAESEMLGLHLSRDIADLMSGRFPSIGRGRPTLTVLDYTQATPSAIFTCEVEDVVTDRAQNFPNPWQKNWYSVSFDLLDYYGDEND